MTENTEVTEPTTKSFTAPLVTLTAPNGKVYEFLLWNQSNLVQFTSINVNQIAVNADDPILQRITDPPEGFVPVGQNGYKFSQKEVSIALTEDGAEALQEAFVKAGINVTNVEQEAGIDE